ncbi:hypothetical protein AXG93_2024s1090 [Marchantia polymorpha subsp. ruderalis]|uniref:Uncharacterized protein n=1 Tax=Marchantia polymorpha subsp. ruderalis TaxID=1480154 RepID=A0A176VKC1_MARPO|nr:hypothetical protein AXG93_2024s1090 [Marchantia polymorpha subsp. ruderalis]
MGLPLTSSISSSEDTDFQAGSKPLQGSQADHSTYPSLDVCMKNQQQPRSASSSSSIKGASSSAECASVLVEESECEMKAVIPWNFRELLSPIRLTLPQDHGQLALVMQQSTTLQVLLPNNIALSVSMVLNEQTEIQHIIHAIFIESQKSASHSLTIQSDREIDWKSSWLESVTGEPLIKEHLIKMKNQPSATVVLQHLWDLTPQPQMLGRLPQGYSLLTALADEVDNALQAVWETTGHKRLISLNTKRINLLYRGTLGRTKHRAKNIEAIGGHPPFLKPYLGKYGAGGVAAALHLGGCVKVSSKTLASKRVVTLVLDLQGLEERSNSSENLWKVEITRLKEQYCISKQADGRNYWKVAQLKRQLKDIYFLYIQSDDGVSSKVTCPVNFRVNNQDLLEVTDCEISIVNMHTCNGEPFVCDMEFTKPVEGSHNRDINVERAHIRIKCDYFPNIRGREMLQEVIDKLRELDKDYQYNFDTMPRVGVRWLGRLLPDAKWPNLPFMDVALAHKKQGEVHRIWTKRVKAFVDTDAGFHPTQSKTDLEKDHPFTTALRTLGGSHDGISAEGVKIRIRYMDKLLPLEELSKVYMRWLQKMHEEFDQEVTFLDPPTFIFHQESLKELKVNKPVAILHKKIKLNELYTWEINDENPIRLKLGRGCLGTKGAVWVTLEFFYCAGTDDERGEVNMICRPIEAADEDGSKLEYSEGQLTFRLNKSLCFPFLTLLSEKCHKVDESEWSNQVKRYGGTSPSFVEVLSQEDSERFGLQFIHPYEINEHLIRSMFARLQALPRSGTTVRAGYGLPEDLLVVVRPRKGHGPSFKKGRIISEPMKVSMKVMFKSQDGGSLTRRKIKAEDETEQLELLHETTSQCIIHPSGVKGLYSFSTKGTNFSTLTRRGEYTFQFELISDDYRFVQPAIRTLIVEAADGKSDWTIFTCDTQDSLTIRLDEKLKYPLFIERRDEFGNTMPLGDLKEVTLVTVGKDVFPGDIALVELKSDTTLALKSFYPEEIIQQLTIQARDKFGNQAAQGQKLKVVLDGLSFFNESSLWEVDETGQLQLGGLLKITGPFSTTGSIKFVSESNVDLLEVPVKVVDRFLQKLGELPSEAWCGMQLAGVDVEIVDERGERDTSVDAAKPDSVELEVSWIPNAAFKFTEGVCTLPTIQLPRTPGVWAGTCYISNRHQISLGFEVEVRMADANILAHATSGPEVIETKSGEPFRLRFRALVDTLGEPGVLTDELQSGLVLSVACERPRALHPDKVFWDFVLLKVEEGVYEAVVSLSRTTGTYFLELTHLESKMIGMVRWKILLRHGKLTELLPLARDVRGIMPKQSRAPLSSCQVAVGDLLPALEILLLDSEKNFCTRYDGRALELQCRKCPQWKVLSAEIANGAAEFESLVMYLDKGEYELYAELDDPEVSCGCSIDLRVIHGNYPSQIKVDTETATEICLSGETQQFLPELVITLDSADGRRLKNKVQVRASLRNTECAESTPLLTLPDSESGMASSVSNNELVLYDETANKRKRHCGDSKYVFDQLPVPRRAGNYRLKIHLPEFPVDPIWRLISVKHGPPHRLEICHATIGEELQQLEVKLVDAHDNICSESFGELRLSFTIDTSALFPSEGISQPCPLLSKSTAELIAGVCKFDKLEFGSGLEGMYQMHLFYEGPAELPVKSEAVRVLITSGKIVQSVLDRLNNLQSLTQDLKAMTHEISRLCQELETEKNRLEILDRKIDLFEENIKQLREELDVFDACYEQNKEMLEAEKERDKLLQTREDVHEAIKKLPGPDSSPLDFCEKFGRGLAAKSNALLDLVVMLAGVEDERLNRHAPIPILSVYLGRSSLLLIACETREQLRQSYASKLWNGRCEVICLEELSECTVPTDVEHPQKLLCLPEPVGRNGQVPRGFLGFAVNLIHLQPEHMHTRRTLFFHLLGECHVYDSEENMNQALNDLPCPPGAMSLDGAFVKDRLRHPLGRGCPTICFPAVPFEERSQCSLLPPACEAFKSLKRRNDVGEQIQQKMSAIRGCEQEKTDSSSKIQRMEQALTIQKQNEQRLQDMMSHLVKEVETVKSVAELIDSRSLDSGEQRLRIFLVYR